MNEYQTTKGTIKHVRLIVTRKDLKESAQDKQAQDIEYADVSKTCTVIHTALVVDFYETFPPCSRSITLLTRGFAVGVLPVIRLP